MDILENSESAKDVWALTDSWGGEPGWFEGSVEVKASELASIADNMFRVSKYNTI